MGRAKIRISGDTLRTWRRSRSWDLPAMASALRDAGDDQMPTQVSMVRMIRGWENKGLTSERYELLYARVFRVQPDELRTVLAESAELDSPPPNVLALTSNPAPKRVSVPAWELPKSPQSAASGGMMPPVTVRDEIEGPVAPELVDYFRSQLAGHYTADMYLGPRHLIPTVQTQADLITRLAAAADAPVRRGLLDTGTAYAALLGWLEQDAGDLEASGRWRDVTLSLAHRSGDQQLISYALTNKAMLALDFGDGRAVVDYTQAALRDEHQLAPKVRVLALQHQAHGQAMLGNRAEADRLLDKASTLTAWVDDDYPWGNACRRTPYYVEVQRATSYGRTGNPLDAADGAALWDQIMDAMPGQARRDNAVFRARQAAALAVVPDPERVVSIAEDAATAVQATGSARLRQELEALPERAAAWAHTATGKQLGNVIASLS